MRHRDLYTRVRRTNTLESKTGNGHNLVILLPGIYPAYRQSHNKYNKTGKIMFTATMYIITKF